MELQKISIKGFKSFADKTDILFKDGVTAIVGPNGSGKSNISDAVRWVLGEQSMKSLRGMKAEDIIFSGTDKRKPLGYAEVSISFNNDKGEIPIDYREVTVTRRVFRSGDSEYYINKSQCRLRDVRELFMDTGIGKEGYSIIGQGRIEEILSNKSEDRRGIFEEAAGIIKYRTKKEEAERKLKKTEDNILRINDLIFELEVQWKNLRKQSERALEYKDLYDHMKNMELRNYINEVDAIDIDLFNKMESLELYLLESQSLKDKDGETFKLMQEKETAIRNLKNSLEILNKSFIETRDAISNNKYKQDLLVQRSKYEDENLNRTKSEIHQSIVIIEKSKAELEALSLELERSGLERLELEESFKAVDENSKTRIQSLIARENKLEEEKNEIVNLFNKKSEISTSINSIRAFNTSIKNRMENLHKSIEDNQVKIDELNASYSPLSIELNQDEESLSKLKSREAILKESILSEKSTRSDLEKEINKLNINLESGISNYKLLKNLEDNMDGYYKGVKSILKLSKSNKDLFPGMEGIVLDLFKVDGKYQLAIDTSLGGSAQHVVTENELEGKKIIEYLRSNSLGKVTCLPINVIRGKKISLKEEDFKEYNVIGTGVDIIEFDKKYQEIFLYLLGRTIVVKTMDDAIKLNRKYKYSLRIVTLEGDIINPGGSMTGGSYNKNALGLVGRKSKLEDLEGEISKNRDLKEKINFEIKNLEDEISQKEKENYNLNLYMEGLALKLIDKKKDLEIILRTRDQLESLKINWEKEIGNLQVEMEKNLVELKEYSDELETYNTLISEKQSYLELENKKIGENRAEREEILQEVSEFKVRLESIKSRNEKINEDMKLKEETIDQREKLIVDLEKNIETYRVNLENIKLDHEGLLDQLEGLEEKYLKYGDSSKMLKLDLGRLEEENDQLKINRERLVGLINDNQKKILDERLSIDKLEFRKENFIMSLIDDYGFDLDRAREEIKSFVEIEFTQEELRKMKSRLRKLGDINMGSIEEFAEIDHRLSFILEQKEDLDKSKKDLEKIIKDMEKEMRDKFLESFNIINNNFQVIFKELFAGGNAKLILDDPEDILNSGIDIEAQPPGKKLQNLSLLSGGEKSLTAVAILFSILKIKPSPFCILDEIDAALDEANIDRYTDYLDTIKEDTQFIIITHRKRTMEIANVLYGVTMEEKGVSKILSIELKDKEELVG